MKNIINHSYLIQTILLIFITSLFLSSCARQPTRLEISNADYGLYPINFKKIIKESMEKSLFDPYSAVYSNWNGPIKGYTGGNFIKTEFGFMVCVNINAKNRMGAYTGSQNFYFLIKSNIIVKKYTGYGAHKLCTF